MDSYIAAARAAESATAVHPDDVGSVVATMDTAITEWLGSHVEQFDPFAWHSLAERTPRRRAFSECALHCYVRDGYDRAVDDGLAELLTDRVNDDRYYEFVLRQPRHVLEYLVPFYYADQRGDLSDGARNAVERALSMQGARAGERTPYRMLDLWHSYRVLGVDGCPLSAGDIVPVSCLAQPPDIVDSTMNDAYAVTHGLFYVYDFGIDEDRFPPTTASVDLQTTVNGLLLRYLAVENYDVALELLVAGLLDGVVSQFTARLVLAAVSEAVEEHGFVPGLDPRPGTERSQFEHRFDLDVDEVETIASEWAHNYHPTLIGGLAMPVIEDHWPDEPGVTGDEAQTATDAMVLGHALDALAEYELERGSKLLVDLEGSPVREAYPGIVESARSFVARQRRADDRFGYWPSERLLFEKSGGSDQLFEQNALGDLHTDCEAALDALSEAAEQRPS